MRYEINGEVVKFYLDDPRRKPEPYRAASFVGTSLTEQQITPILETLVRNHRGLSLSSQENVIPILRAFFVWFQVSRSPWPTTSDEWNFFMVRFFQFWLTDTSYSKKAKTSTRAFLWSTLVNPWLTGLKDEEIIPLDVQIPVIRMKKVRSLAKDQSLLGERRRIITSRNEQSQKLLVDINFGKTDADYLDSVERKCRHLVGVIKDVCLTHWNRVMKDAETGRQLAAELTDADIDRAIAERRFSEGILHGARRMQTDTKFASPSHPQGIQWALAVVRHTLKNSQDIYCISGEALRSSPFFNDMTFKGKQNSFSALDGLTSLQPEQWQQLQSQARFYRFAGLLSPPDVASACALLTIEHPNFNSESLQNAVLLNVRGKPRLILTDNEKQPIFCVDKPRAGSLKYAALSELAQQILTDIVRATAPVRAALKRAGDKTWRYLFLGVQRRINSPGVLSVVDGGPEYLNGRKESVGLARLYPVLGQNGLLLGSFDYRRIRNTMGIIKWFESGSILEMSRTLGNTRKVALEHYIPPALLHAWNTRIIRRFQNTLIVLAAHDEPYLLDVTDFSNMGNLQHFIAQLILDYPAKTSPLADEVQRRLGSASQTESVMATSTPGFLNIRLSAMTLAYLYAYDDLARKTLSDEQMDKVDTLSGLAPRQFVDMATLVKHAAESKSIHPALRDHLDVTRLVDCHWKALALQVGLDARFAKWAVEREWEKAA